MDVKTMEYMQEKVSQYRKLNETKKFLQSAREDLIQNDAYLRCDDNCIDFNKNSSFLDEKAQTEFKEELKNQIINVIDNNIIKIEKRMEEI